MLHQRKILKQACPEEILDQVQNDTFRVQDDNYRIVCKQRGIESVILARPVEATLAKTRIENLSVSLHQRRILYEPLADKSTTRKAGMTNMTKMNY
jgi:hypothetical protein